MFVSHAHDRAGHCGMREHEGDCSLRGGAHSPAKDAANLLELESREAVGAPEVVLVQALQ